VQDVVHQEGRDAIEECRRL
jgi:hypothetical protein